VESAIELALGVIRDSAMPEEVIAEKGFFHQTLDPKQSNQLLRISIPAGEIIYPEVSAGKHRYSVRFLNPLPIDHLPTQIKEDVTFSLTRCSL
jgi:cell division protein ZapD